MDLSRFSILLKTSIVHHFVCYLSFIENKSKNRMFSKDKFGEFTIINLGFSSLFFFSNIVLYYMNLIVL